MSRIQISVWLPRLLKWGGAVFGIFIVVLIGAITYGFMAPSEINYVYKNADPDVCEDLPEAPDRFLGVGFSGGGSRAAMFAAGGTAALQDAGLLKKVTHISSVSGGGFTSSYLATHGQSNCGPTVRGANSDNCLSVDLEEMTDALSKDYFWAMEWKQAVNPVRYFSPSRRIISLQEALEDGFIGKGRTFKTLPTQPAFYYNTVSYDSAERFVLSNQPLPHQTDFDNSALSPDLRTVSFTEREDCAVSTPDDFPLALAVVTSAAFPPVLGPLTIEIPARLPYGKTEYWHLGDGGVIENTGLDTLIDAALVAKSRNPYLTEATLVSFNAGLRLLPDVSVSTNDLSLWSSDPGRLVDVSNLRADTYRDAYLREISKRSGLTINIVEMDFLNANLTEWPEECAVQKAKPVEDIKKIIVKIPTDLAIDTCHAALMLKAAKAMVDVETAEGGKLFGLR